MSILNEYVKKEGKTTWIEMATKIKYLRLP